MENATGFSSKCANLSQQRSPQEQRSTGNLDGNQLKTKFASLRSKPRFLTFAEADLLYDEAASIVGLPPGQQVIDYPGQLMGGGCARRPSTSRHSRPSSGSRGWRPGWHRSTAFRSHWWRLPCRLRESQSVHMAITRSMARRQTAQNDIWRVNMMQSTSGR